MKRLVYLPLAVVIALPVCLGWLCVTRTAWAAPAWGGNCLSCHNVWHENAVWINQPDGIVDPDETQTGAPDRGPLPYFRAFRGATKTLHMQVLGLNDGDTYAATLRRLRFPGVEQGGQISYVGDCDWPEWGDNANYFTHPEIAHRWGPGPVDFTFEITIPPYADLDYYNAVFAVGGKYGADNGLFYDHEHFYLEVRDPVLGDANCDGAVTFTDINFFVAAISGEQSWINYHLAQTGNPPACPYTVCDINQIPPVDFQDIMPFIQLIGGGK